MASALAAIQQTVTPIVKLLMGYAPTRLQKNHNRTTVQVLEFVSEIVNSECQLDMFVGKELYRIMIFLLHAVVIPITHKMFV